MDTLRLLTLVIVRGSSSTSPTMASKSMRSLCWRPERNLQQLKDNDSFGSQCLRNLMRQARISVRQALVFLCQPASVLLHTLRVRSLSGAERLQIGRTGKLADTCAHKYLHQSARTSLRSPLLRHLRAARSANYQPRSRKCFQQHAANLDTGSNFTGTSDMIGLS